jgi:hypothetical protein
MSPMAIGPSRSVRRGQIGGYLRSGVGVHHHDGPVPGPERGLQLLRAGAFCGYGGLPSHGDDDLAAGVAVDQVSDGCGDVTQDRSCPVCGERRGRQQLRLQLSVGAASITPGQAGLGSGYLDGEANGLLMPQPSSTPLWAHAGFSDRARGSELS